MTADLKDYRLPRTGRLPLEFRGECLATAYGDEKLDEKAKSKNPRWHELELYRTAAGKYVLSVRYRTDWPEEAGFDDVLVLEGPDDVASCLRQWDATGSVKGYPNAEVFKWKQDRLLRQVKARWDRCVGELLGQLGPGIAERID